MRRLLSAVILFALVSSPLAFVESLSAAMCTTDAVPAATLLLPYFEVDLNDAAGVTTLFSINNAEASPALAHVIFWTDWGFPTLGFDVYLTGYDVLSINLRDVFEGNIPITSDAPNDEGQADNDTVCGTKSPCGGNFSLNRHWDDHDPESVGEQGFPFCDAIFPFFDNPVIAGPALDRLVNGHTGQTVASVNACAGFDHGDNVARGYITIDNASECSLIVDPTGSVNGKPYFSNGGQGIANNINQLWGDWTLLDPANASAKGNALVHIEAFDDLNADDLPLIHPGTGETTSTVAHDTRQTFYGRHFDDGRDNREPLGSIWASRYLNGGAFDESQTIVWRDSTVHELNAVPVGEAGSWCESGPSWFPLDETEVLAFNEIEDAVEICIDFGGIADPPLIEDIYCYPLATGRYDVGAEPADIPFEFGWMYLNLNLPEINFPEAWRAQSHVTTLHSALGLYSVGLEAIALRNACESFNELLNIRAENGGVNFIPNF